MFSKEDILETIQDVLFARYEHHMRKLQDSPFHGVKDLHAECYLRAMRELEVTLENGVENLKLWAE